mgnify:CR=1 FL=1
MFFIFYFEFILPPELSSAITLEGLPKQVGWVSFEAQAELIAAELKKDDEKDDTKEQN